MGWLFLINLPIGVLAVVLASLFLPADDNGTRSERGFDLLGSLTLSPSLVLFLYGSDHLNKREGLMYRKIKNLPLPKRVKGAWEVRFLDGEPDADL